MADQLTGFSAIVFIGRKYINSAIKVVLAMNILTPDSILLHF